MRPHPMLLSGIVNEAKSSVPEFTIIARRSADDGVNAFAGTAAPVG